MTIKADGSIATRLISSYEGSDSAVADIQNAWVASVDDMLGEKIAVADTNFYISDPETGKRRIRMAETNLGDFVADGIYSYFNEVEQLHCDIAIMNGGGIRADEKAGYWTFKTCKQVSPFGNVACLMSVTGKQIQDALEFAARFAGTEKENGGFLHVAGASYEIHADIPNTVQTDEKNVWIGSATGTPRVQNVKIYNKASGTYEPLDESKTYALAGMNYTLRNLGDGFAMFDGAELIKDYVSEDYLVMSTYAMTFGGVDAEGLPHPDIHSLLLLSALFDVSLDQLIKGDLETMKQEVNAADVRAMNRDGIIYTILLAATIILPVPLIKWFGLYGLIPELLLWGSAMYFALRLERIKKANNVQSYREILAFSEGRKLDEIEQKVEAGKRPYQKFLLVLLTAGITLLVGMVLSWLLL